MLYTFISFKTERKEVMPPSERKQKGIFYTQMKRKNYKLIDLLHKYTTNHKR